MTYSIKHIASVVQGTMISFHRDQRVEYLLTDSRKIIFPASSIFFALKGPRRDGHIFLQDLYERGVRCFVVSDPPGSSDLPEANIIRVNDTTIALQQLAAMHRSHFSIPVIGITGSNGKTIVKEWLNQMLMDRYNIVRSPKSYNSQIGVPLSVWQLEPAHTLAIFEAGISQPGEMQRLEKIIRPTIGIFTNIGEAHGEGFASHREKALEKMKLFRDVEKLIYCKDAVAPFADPDGSDRELFGANTKFYSWSREKGASLMVTEEKRQQDHTLVTGSYNNETFHLTIPFTDRASVDNAITCSLVLLTMGESFGFISQRLLQLHSVSMRLELKKGIGNCSIVNDSYSADLSSLKIALDFMAQQQQHSRQTVILSDFLQTGMAEKATYESIAASLGQFQVERFIGVGPVISSYKNVLAKAVGESLFYESTDDLKKDLTNLSFHNEAVLLKGARVFEFEKIAQVLEEKVHGTVLEIDLNALAANLKAYQQLLHPGTKMMAMVKAFAYGSGTHEIARVLQFHKTDYLGVAYADEGVELRKAGITLPIMVMNTEDAAFDSLVQYNLEPVLYDFNLLSQFRHFLNLEGLNHFPVHIEVETGMNRLGFNFDEIEKLSGEISDDRFVVRSVFSHLAASEDPQHDQFSASQVELFNQACEILQNRISYPFLRHIANTAAIQRNPGYQFDMVRLGIGMYGIDTVRGNSLNLQEVSTLKTTIAQIKQLRDGDTVSYGRKGMASGARTIATVRLGYADGYPRSLSNGNGKMWINGRLAPVIGIICMDMTMIDITGIPDVKEGDEVVVFGKELPVTRVANWANTIPYEILTGISQRVRRVYYQD